MKIKSMYTNSGATCYTVEIQMNFIKYLFSKKYFTCLSACECSSYYNKHVAKFEYKGSKVEIIRVAREIVELLPTDKKH